MYYTLTLSGFDFATPLWTHATQGMKLTRSPLLASSSSSFSGSILSLGRCNYPIISLEKLEKPIQNISWTLSLILST